MIQLKALWGWVWCGCGSLDSDNLFHSSSSFDVNQSFPSSGACSIILRSCNRLNWADFDLTCGYRTVTAHPHASQGTGAQKTTHESFRAEWAEAGLMTLTKNQSRDSPPVESCRTPSLGLEVTVSPLAMRVDRSFAFWRRPHQALVYHHYHRNAQAP